MFGIRSSIDYFRMRSRFSQILVLFGPTLISKGRRYDDFFQTPKKWITRFFCLGKEHPLWLGGPGRLFVFWLPGTGQDQSGATLGSRASQPRPTCRDAQWMSGHCLGYFAWSMWLLTGEYLYTYRSYRLFTVSWERKMLIQSVQDTRMLHSLQDFIGQVNVSTIPIACFPDKTWMIFKNNFRTLPRLLPGYFAPEAVGIPTAFGWAECQDGGIRRGNISEWLSLWHLPRNLKMSPWMTK